LFTKKQTKHCTESKITTSSSSKNDVVDLLRQVELSSMSE